MLNAPSVLLARTLAAITTLIYARIIKTKCYGSSGSGTFSLGGAVGTMVLGWGHSIGTTTGFLLRTGIYGRN